MKKCSCGGEAVLFVTEIGNGDHLASVSCSRCLRLALGTTGAADWASAQAKAGWDRMVTADRAAIKVA